MAQSKPHKETLQDVSNDLYLLFPKGSDTVFSIDQGTKLRDKKIEDLKRTNGTLQKGYERILKGVEETRNRRHMLKKYYKELNSILQETTTISQTEQEGFLAEAKKHFADLEKQRYTILIAGETSAGKSSLINVLLNDHVLPTCIKQNTQTICKISYGTKKKAMLHFSNPSTRVDTLDESEFDKIKKYIEKPVDDDHWCERIEIEIRSPLLKGGVVIIDSPGIGDEERVNKIPLEYLPQASVFIYVINSANAGGIQEDRLMRILGKWKELYNGGERCDITAESALFVCNKWDEVERQAEQNQEEDLQKDIVDKLRQKIPELDEESQMIKMSVLRAAEVQKRFHVMSDDLYSLINGLQRLLTLYVERKTDLFYYWISGELCRLSDLLKVAMRNAKRNEEERLKVREQLKVQLEKLEQGTSIREFDDAISNHMKNISQQLRSYLRSDDFRRRFCSWEEKDLPDIDDSCRTNTTRINETYTRCIEKRFQFLLDYWESKEELYAKAYADLERRFHQSFYDLEKDIHAIDCVLGGDSRDKLPPSEIRPCSLCAPLDPQMKKFLVVTLGIFMPILFPVGLVAGALSAPVIGYLIIDKYLEEQQLRTNPCQALTQASNKSIDAFIEKISDQVERRFSEEKKRIFRVKRCQQQLIDIYKKRCKDLTRSEDESRDKETLEKNGPLNEKLQGMSEMLMFDSIQAGIQVTHPPCQIDIKSLLYNKRDTLGTGSYGAVFTGKFTPPGHEKEDVAVKRLNDAPCPSNVFCFLQEAAMVKHLKHKHIVGFYGVAMEVENHKLLSVALVFQLCTESLKSHIFENSRRIPWRTPNAATDTFRWIKQILDALEFIHSRKTVHRDLKLDNILISGHDIRVADLGLAKFKDRITGTICGTRLYMAPEVHEGKLYSTEADMYSFGLVMWEMWFGERVFSEPHHQSLSRGELFRRIREENYRPQTPRGDGGFDPNLPPAQWTEIMTSCWQTEPNKRKTATECKAFIQEIEHQYVK